MNTLIRIVLIVIGLGAVVLIAMAVTQETYKRYQIQKEISDLQSQAGKKERENQKLKGLIEYFKTNDFQEKEAKEQLSLQKEGEKVIVVKDEKTNQNDNSSSNSEVSMAPTEDTRSNLRRWWDYFFAD